MKSTSPLAPSQAPPLSSLRALRPHRPPLARRASTWSLLLCALAVLFPLLTQIQAAWQWTQPPILVHVQSTRRGHVFYKGEAVVLKLSGPGASRYNIRDYYGNTVEQGGLSSTSLAPAVREPGWYKVNLHGGNQGMPFGDSVGSGMFCILRDDPNFPKMPAPGTFGGEGLVDEVTRGVLGYGPQRHKVDNAAAADSEIPRLERELGLDQKYYLPYDSYRKRDLLVVFPNGTWDQAGVRKIVERFKGVVKYWEPRNEPNFSTSATAFVQNELKPFYELVKSIDPSLKVIAPGAVTVGPPMAGWNDEFFRAGGGKYIDAFSFHAYNCVNGDLGLTRMSLDQVNTWLNKYNLAGMEKWQTEQGFLGPVYGAYQPRMQGRWTMLQMMVYEQYGIPKEHNHYWYDRNGGFWDEPRWVQNEDGSINPVGVLLRVWSEELAGTRFASSLDFGNPGNKLFVGSIFQGPGKQVAALMTSGETRGRMELSVTGTTSVKVVSPFGGEQQLAVVNGKVSVAVSELPTYVEYTGTLSVAPANWGANLALQSGVSAAASGSTVHPIDGGINNTITKVFNGQLDTWYWSQARDARIWESNNTTYPAWFELRFPADTTMDRVAIYAGIPWQWDGSILDYELQVEQGGQWVSLERVQEPVNTFRAYTQTNRTTVDSFYSERCVFTHSFAPVTTRKIRLLVHEVTWGGASNKDLKDAGAQGGEHQLNLREIEVYRSGLVVAGGSAPVAVADSADCPRGGRVSIPVLANDTAGAAGPYPLRLLSVSMPSRGSAAVSGDQVVYSASPGLSGADSFSYVVSDGFSTATGVVNVMVSATPEALRPDTHGLYAQWFNNADFTSLAFARVDPYVDNNWGTNAPDPAVDAGSYSIRWTGKLTPKFTEAYTLYTLSDDGVRLWVDGKLLIDHWSAHAGAWDQATLPLVAGQPVDVKLEYFQGGGGAQITFQWSSPGQPREVVPFDALTVGAAGPLVAPANRAPVAVGDAVWTPVGMPVSVSVLGNDRDPDLGPAELRVSAVGTPANGTAVLNGGVVQYVPSAGYQGVDSFTYTLSDGDLTATATVSVTVAGPDPTRLSGLKGEYFGRIDLTAPVLARLDGTINQSWGEAAPDPALPKDGFSVRWTGTVTPRFSETYTFAATSDDGVRVWVNGAQIAQNWSDHAPTEVSGSIGLVAGRPVDIKVEYYESTGGAMAALRWSSQSTPVEIVPGWALSTAPFGSTPPVVVPVANKAPVALADAAVTQEAVAVVVPVLANDSDPDAGPQALSVSALTQPSRGTAALVAGGIRYTPNAGFVGTDTFGYSLSDGSLSAGASVTVTVQSTARANDLTSAGLVALPIGGASGGSRILADGSWELSGAGIGTAGSADAMRLEGLSVSGDFRALVRVRSVAGPTGARAGLMLRESAQAGARCVAVGVAPDGRYRLGARVAAGAAYAETQPAGADAVASLPEGWVLLERAGDAVRLSVSSDGAVYRPVGAYALGGLGASVQVGVYVASGAPEVSARAVLDQWSLIQQVSGGGTVQNGLLGVYFSRADLTLPVAARVDGTVDFDWVVGSPHPALGGDGWSARWTGQLVPPVSGLYTFFTRSDDGVRLWVNGQQLVNNWTLHAVTENSGTVQLQAGVPVDVRLEFFENSAQAVCKLWWSAPGISKQPVPSAVLRPAMMVSPLGGVAAPVVVSLADGVRQVSALGSGLGAVGAGDQGGFWNQLRSADFQLALRVRSVTGGSAPAAAVMLREGLGAGDRFAALQLAGDGSVSVRSRSALGGAVVASAVPGVLVPPSAWLLVERRGDRLALATSTDDVTYTAAGSVELAGLPQLAYVGGWVHGGTGTAPGVAQFGDLELAAVPGRGLTGEYFGGVGLSVLKFSRVDAGLDFNWGLGSADPRLAVDLFSVRWTGRVKTEAAGVHAFHVQSDDGVRMWVNGQLLVNNWSDHPLTENTGMLSLPAGTWVNLRLEYYERAGSAALRLLWTPPGQSKRVISAESLGTP